MNITLKRVRVTVVVEKQYITYCECVFVALVIQHDNTHAPYYVASVTCLALQYFSTLSHKRYDFRGKIFIEHKMCV